MTPNEGIETRITSRAPASPAQFDPKYRDKYLNRGAKLAEAEKLTQTAAAENRDLDSNESQRFDSLIAEIDSIDAATRREDRQSRLDTAKRLHEDEGKRSVAE